ncbi:MAG: two-component sensor histidine kinase [Actinobacteria bacterium]|nr:two-component sensor histidine kinase [Actinomycetota bacterium]MCB0920743.1 two-component sensor histidine kinase [Actinomycetota bacterium]MCB8997436.1 two-component sensor histidine kinase [Actinomycetota bacterium]
MVGVGVGLLVARRRAGSAVPDGQVLEPDPEPHAELERVLSALPAASIVVDASGTPVRVSKQALALTLVQNGRIAIPDITAMVADVRRDGVIREQEMTVLRPPLGKGLITLRLRVAPLGPDTVLVLAEDLTESARVDAVRRDFVANVSHELKTPIGALSLLAEAILSSSEEPEAVRHFAGRMEAEAGRLSALVGDLIDLSRLQGEDPLKDAEPVSVDAVIAEAVDTARLMAQTAQIEVVVGGAEGLQVLGVEAHLVTALRNLLTNAISYSPRGTRVAVASRLTNGVIEISVTDQGMGIPDSELHRVFERFYRVDQARSRVTGGTGLGLAIVKHVAENHGGEVGVWSVLGEGSTFTLRLPPYTPVEHIPLSSAVVEEESSA